MTASTLWTPDTLATVTGGTVHGNPKPIAGASIDTRTLQPGDLFFAVKGDRKSVV